MKLTIFVQAEVNTDEESLALMGKIKEAVKGDNVTIQASSMKEFEVSKVDGKISVR